MKVKVKLTQKQYIELMVFIGKLNFTDYMQINNIDVINYRKLYFDALRKYEGWCTTSEFHKGVKLSTINIDINHINSLSKLLFEFQLIKSKLMTYHESILLSLINQSTQQISIKSNQYLKN